MVAGEGRHTTETETHDTIRHELGRALKTVGPLVTMSREGLVITALDWDAVPARPYETATAAARDGGLELREQGVGTVPTIEALTKEKPVVIFAGDTVVGGKQNRIINVTVWLPAAKATAIPVSCLEAGRWNAGSRFEASRKVDYGLRAMVADQLVQYAYIEAAAPAPAGTAAGSRRQRTYRADQGAVWQEIAMRQARAGVNSQTAALHDLYEREALDIAAFVAAFPCPAGAKGLAVGVGGKVIALELFDAEATLAEQWPRLVEGAVSAYADHRRAVTAGLVPPAHHRYPDAGAIGRLVGRAAASLERAVVDRSVGEGFDVRLAGTRVRGGALVVEGRPVHLELFRAEA